MVIYTVKAAEIVSCVASCDLSDLTTEGNTHLISSLITAAATRQFPPGRDPEGFFLGAVMIRTTFLIDGFNLYHSLRKAEADTGQRAMRWLDLHRMCSNFLYLIGHNSEALLPWKPSITSPLLRHIAHKARNYGTRCICNA
jgi:hypothetical protein